MKVDFIVNNQYFIWDTQKHIVEVRQINQVLDSFSVPNNIKYENLKQLIKLYSPKDGGRLKWECYV